MVEGIESFIRKFADYSDCYTIIGGAACDILMTEADTGFRATHDIDMIIIMEARYREFARVFWEYVLEGRKIISGVSVLDTEHIIPFKMYAWLDLKDKKARGEHVNDRDLKKHKNDVFRLLRIIDRGISIETSGLVRENIVRFCK